MKKILLIALGLVATGCATPYQSGKFAMTGGYNNARATEKLEKVVFYANGFTTGRTAQKYALFRSAEFANENKKPYFLIFPSLNEAALARPGRLPNVGFVGGKPAAYSYVLLLDDARPGAMKTSEILKQLESMKTKN